MRNSLRRLANAIMGVMMAAMFAVFILQIVSRYLAKYNMGGSFIWTQDLAQALMVWIVFFGGAFALADSDHVKFDMIYNMFGTTVRRVMAIVACSAIAGLFAWSLFAIVDSWLGMLWRWSKPNPTLRWPIFGTPVPLWAIYSITAVFMAVVALGYLERIVRMGLGAAPDHNDAPEREPSP